jgi:hypothetical protein
MTPDDQMAFELEIDEHEPVTAEGVRHFLSFFDVPKVDYQIALGIVNEMFRPLVDEVETVSKAVMEWCNVL